MNPVSGVVVFIMIWWTVIFCILPIGQSTTQETPDSEDEYLAPGAPKHLNMKKKFIITTLVSIVIWCIIYAIIISEIVDFRLLADEIE